MPPLQFQSTTFSREDGFARRMGSQALNRETNNGHGKGEKDAGRGNDDRDFDSLGKGLSHAL